MKLLTCAALNCTNTFPFDPTNPCRKFCDELCGARTRMRLKRERDLQKFGPDGGGGKRQQRSLFPRPLAAKAKPPKPVPVMDRTLFEGGSLAAPRKAAEREECEIAVGATA
jgi:hypothetical protein